MSTPLTNAVFLGNAPTMGYDVFDGPVTVDYYNGATGFTSPTWTDSSGDRWSAVDLDPPINTWNLNYFGTNASNPAVSGDTVINNAAGLTNLMAYALGVDPYTATVGALPVCAPTPVQAQIISPSFSPQTPRRRTSPTPCRGPGSERLELEHDQRLRQRRVGSQRQRHGNLRDRHGHRHRADRVRAQPFPAFANHALIWRAPRWMASIPRAMPTHRAKRPSPSP